MPRSKKTAARSAKQTPAKTRRATKKAVAKKAVAAKKTAATKKRAAKKKKAVAKKAVAAKKAAAAPVTMGQHIGYRYDVNLLPDPAKLTPFLRRYIAAMGWRDLNWLEDVHMGYEEGRPAVFDRNINGWVTVPRGMKLPADQQGRDMIARELLVKFQMSPRHPLAELKRAYGKI